MGGWGLTGVDGGGSGDLRHYPCLGLPQPLPRDSRVGARAHPESPRGVHPGLTALSPGPRQPLVPSRLGQPPGRSGHRARGPPCISANENRGFRFQMGLGDVGSRTPGSGREPPPAGCWQEDGGVTGVSSCPWCSEQLRGVFQGKHLDREPRRRGGALGGPASTAFCRSGARPLSLSPGRLRPEHRGTPRSPGVFAPLPVHTAEGRLPWVGLVSAPTASRCPSLPRPLRLPRVPRQLDVSASPKEFDVLV